MNTFDLKIRNKNDFITHYNNVIEERMEYEKKLAEKCQLAPNRKYEVEGYCKVCEDTTKFLVDFSYSNNIIPNYRERLACRKCGLNNRQRYVTAKIKAEYKPGQKIYMYEQITSAYKAVKSFSDDVVGSEFLGPDIKSGTIINEIRHEDAECLSFSDESFDVIVSCDVFEHVSDIDKCMSEANRILKKNGKMILSVPFNASKEITTKRAEIVDGKLINILEPVFHGNPMSKDGSLVFYDYGWDLLDIIFKAGFSDVYLISYYSIECGYIGGVQIIMEAIK